MLMHFSLFRLYHRITSWQALTVSWWREKGFPFHRLMAWERRKHLQTWAKPGPHRAARLSLWPFLFFKSIPLHSVFPISLYSYPDYLDCPNPCEITMSFRFLGDWVLQPESDGKQICLIVAMSFGFLWGWVLSQMELTSMPAQLTNLNPTCLRAGHNRMAVVHTNPTWMLFFYVQ